MCLQRLDYRTNAAVLNHKSALGKQIKSFIECYSFTRWAETNKTKLLSEE